MIIGALVVMFVMPKFSSGAADAEQSATAETEQQTSKEASATVSDMQVVSGSGIEPEPSDSVSPEELVKTRYRSLLKPPSLFGSATGEWRAQPCIGPARNSVCR